jgi:hypothetical protein
VGVFGGHGDTGNYGYLGAFQYGAYGENKEGKHYGFLGATNAGVGGYHTESGIRGYIGTKHWGVHGVHRSANEGMLGGDSAGVFGYGNGSNDFGVYGINGRHQNYGYLGGEHCGVYGRGGYGDPESTDEACGIHGYGEGRYNTAVYAEHSSGNRAKLGSVAYALYAEHCTGPHVYLGRSEAGLVADCGGSPDAVAAVCKGNVIVMGAHGIVVELGEGLDIAEGFDISGSTQVSMGSVLVIDPDSPGKLRICDKPYDTRVAGIVAGANDQGSGVRLGGGMFEHSVALAGRVYCNVEATAAAVRPGDLLTTSSEPGYAMKAADHERARGAVLGKAMERLEKGERAQILVLVTLQ